MWLSLSFKEESKYKSLILPKLIKLEVTIGKKNALINLRPNLTNLCAIFVKSANSIIYFTLIFKVT